MTSQWNDYFEHNKTQKNYRCPVCKCWSARMKRREVTEPSGDSHKEYQIVCLCGNKTGVHYSKHLTERTWEASGGGIFG